MAPKFNFAITKSGDGKESLKLKATNKHSNLLQQKILAQAQQPAKSREPVDRFDRPKKQKSISAKKKRDEP